MRGRKRLLLLFLAVVTLLLLVDHLLVDLPRLVYAVAGLCSLLLARSLWPDEVQR